MCCGEESIATEVTLHFACWERGGITYVLLSPAMLEVLQRVSMDDCVFWTVQADPLLAGCMAKPRSVLLDRKCVHERMCMPVCVHKRMCVCM